MQRVFIGSEAVTAGEVTKYQLRAHYKRIFPDVYTSAAGELTIRDRALGAVLWSRGRAVVAGLTASALHGAKWVEASAPIELNYSNNKAPSGIVSRAETLFDDEVRPLCGLPVTTLQRTAFDIARRGTVGQAVARVDALANATRLNVDGVLALLPRHPNAGGIDRVAKVLDLADSGSQSPRETWLRLLLIAAGFPRPETQIPVLREDGRSYYFLDMGWRDAMVAVEYDGEQHRLDRGIYRNDRTRSEYIADVGWRRIRVVVGDRTAEIVERTRRAWRLSQTSER
ncbi:hypothetical protein ORI20_31380 [Mycobacterium sp. CVI_P3]|uniref:DUF559 domain-containing protein n=1 Tax=Mycobacterium pinniadriaticum TaxID=2994102 RepID=A0ABT3SQM2_9MYCO|nr:hypothetical protein [Mycobacterium pinniadriaticum]MCX2934770.1 hypothetical protein [Mycobacterium pinniadriaticum]MCX2941185.1 hypothetical protein [Mycobacterium pinniadriaticum]